MDKNNIVVATADSNFKYFIHTEIRSSEFKKIVNDIRNNKLEITTLPKPLHNIVIASYGKGQKCFTIKNKVGNRLEPKYVEQNIYGKAMVLMRDGNEYRGLTQEAFKSMVDSEDVEFIFENS